MINILKKYFSEFAGVIVFFIYLFTLAPSVVQIDSGELATVQALAGIAHPTGYPLFTMIGHIFLLIPFPFTKIFTANILAAVWCALGVIFFIKTSYIVLQNLIPGEKSGHRQRSFVISSVLSGGLILGLSKTFWQQSTSVEVYSLQIFLFSLILYFSFIYWYESEEKKSNKLLPLIAVSLALGFANHMTTLLIIPGFTFIFFSKEKFSTTSLKKILLMLLVFIPVLIILYLYLPLRASANPVLNWGDPISFENFFRHITGKQYQVWLFKSFDAAKLQFVKYFKDLPLEFGYFGLIPIIIGIYYSFKKARKEFYFLGITFLFTVLYSVNYNIHDLAPYFSLSYFALSFFAVLGLYQLIVFINKKVKSINVTSAIPVIFILLELLINFGDVNQSGNYIFEDYTKEILNEVPENSILFTYQWDYFVSPSYYFQYVENYRKDVVVIDKELLRRSWYFKQMKNNYPAVLENLDEKINSFLNALKPFERGEQFNPNLIEKYYRQIMTGLISENINERNYFIGPELIETEMRKGEFSLPAGYTLVPYNLLFKVVKSGDYVPAPEPDFNIRIPEQKNNYINFIKRVIPSMLAYRAFYEMQYHKQDRAKVYVDKIKESFPEFPLPPQLKSLD